MAIPSRDESSASRAERDIDTGSWALLLARRASRRRARAVTRRVHLFHAVAERGRERRDLRLPGRAQVDVLARAGLRVRARGNARLAQPPQGPLVTHPRAF